MLLAFEVAAPKEDGMSLNQYIVRVAPGFLRVYRTRVLLDLPEILAYLPQEGTVLDVGCAEGSTDYTIARLRPTLDITGIDINEAVVEQANRRNSAANVRYLARPLEEMDGQYDCITLIDLLHHAADKEARNLLAQCPRLLAPSGGVFIKDIDKRGGYFSYFMDRFVALANPVRLRPPEEIKALIPDGLKVVSEQRKWKFPQPHLYFRLTQ